MTAHTFVVAAMCVAATFMLLAPQTARAQRSIECQRTWDGPSFDNDVVECLRNRDRIGSQWKYYVYPGFAVLIFLFVLFGIPIIFCTRCCHCCFLCCQPHAENKRAASRCWLWMWTIFAVLWACGVCVLIILGAYLLMENASGSLDDLERGPLDYFASTKNNIVALLTDYSRDPPQPPDVDLTPFDDVDFEFRDKIHLIRDDYFKYFKIARIVSYCVGAVGVALMLCIIIFAACRCGGCCPVAFSTIYFFFAIIFSLLAVLFTLGIYAMSAGCGEVMLQFRREPGIMQWYVVPWCEEEFDFTSLREEVSAEVTQISQEACSKMLEYCDNDPVYPGTNKDHVFMCGQGLTDASECTSLDYVAKVLLTSYAKPILNNVMCTDTTGWGYQEKCTPTECASRCQDYDSNNLRPKTWSMEIVQAANYALNASTALSYVMPMLQCNFIVDKLMAAVESDGPTLSFSSTAVEHCSNFRIGTIMLGTGFFVGALMFIVGIYVLHRGGWIWSTAEEHNKLCPEKCANNLSVPNQKHPLRSPEAADV